MVGFIYLQLFECATLVRNIHPRTRPSVAQSFSYCFDVSSVFKPAQGEVKFELVSL